MQVIGGVAQKRDSIKPFQINILQLIAMILNVLNDIVFDFVFG
jgi:hypothetical protein